MRRIRQLYNEHVNRRTERTNRILLANQHAVRKEEFMTRNRLRRLAAVFVLVVGAAFVLSAVTVAQTETVNIGIRDACDPTTFNAAVGPGTCIGDRHGTTKFQFFIQELQEDRIAGAWRFNPLLKASTGTFQLVRLNVVSGQQTVLQNKGGETHTF